ncbi:shikimate dehydrogenase [Sinomonas mesophila]|uniref:shikimate dehydrogenase n=1 Tax=Sinomonas mesophila TaxID=1531955 RepID=UPI001115AB43|nr:shikimate dehydrogenase [Sinomonas mesophila]
MTEEPGAARAAVLGHPIGHSKSPALHRAAYALLGVEMDYTRFDVTEEGLADFARRVRTEPGWRGLSVTMPLKSAFVPLVDRLEGLAAELGVLNTVVVEDSAAGPVLVGHNTDVAGIVEAFRHAGVSSAGAPVIVGAGNTALAAVAAMKQMHARRVTFLVRDPARAGEAVGLAERLGLDVRVEDIEAAAGRLASADVAVSTLPPRAADGLAAHLADVPELPATDDGAPRVLLDVAYDPWPSDLGRVWEARGGTVLHGLEMLVYQAVEQVVLFTGREEARSPRVTDVMCDSVGVPRRTA